MTATATEPLKQQQRLERLWLFTELSNAALFAAWFISDYRHQH